MPKKQARAGFIEPMLLLRTDKLPEGPEWLIELKLDGYRALAIKSGGKVQLRSRNDNDFNSRYPGIVRALASMPDETVIDGEVVALDEDGRPSFNALQNHGAAGIPLHFFIFDLLMLHGRDVMAEPLVKRRELIERHVLPKTHADHDDGQYRARDTQASMDVRVAGRDERSLNEEQHEPRRQYDAIVEYTWLNNGRRADTLAARQARSRNST
jgi:ATP-dependent DNA ligase